MNRRDSDISRDHRLMLDPVERAIVGELERDPRITNREIADRLELTIAQVAARIRRIEQNDIAHVVAVLNLHGIGQSSASIRLSVQGRAIDDVAQDIAEIDNIGWLAAISGGDADLAGSIRYRDMDELARIIVGRLNRIEGVKNLHVDLHLEELIFRSHHIGFAGRPPDDEASIAAAAAALEAEISDAVPDALDRNIIAELCHDGRISSRELARKYGVNAGTIRYRLKALEGRGILALHALVDPAAVGLRCFSQIRMDVEAAHFDSVVSELRTKDWLPFLLHASGGSNLIGVMLNGDWNEAQDVCVRELRSLPGVGSLSLAQITRNYKVDPRFS